MIGYLTIGADDIAQAKAFYDSVLGTIGWRQFADYGDPVGYAQNEAGDGQTIWICKPFDGGSARAGNGIMVGFDADTREQVHAFHAAATKARPGRGRLTARTGMPPICAIPPATSSQSCAGSRDKRSRHWERRLVRRSSARA